MGNIIQRNFTVNQRLKLYFEVIKFYTLITFYHIDLIRKFKNVINSYGIAIDQRINTLYYKSFISTGFNVEQKLEIIIHQYTVLKNIFRTEAVIKLFNGGIVCWSDRINNSQFYVKLYPATTHLREGCLGLNFCVNDVDIFNLSFTIVPGRLMDIDDPSVIIISRNQYTLNQFENISSVTKTLGDSTPLSIVLYVLEGISRGVGIHSIIGLSSSLHIKFKDAEDSKLFSKNYDALWNRMESVKMRNGNYFMTCPFRRKSVNEIKQKHRSRAFNKRKRLDEISEISYQAINNILRDSRE